MPYFAKKRMIPNPKYIVPIFQYEKFIGSGFVVKDKLFTAQHIIVSSSGGFGVNAYVNGTFYPLSSPLALFSDSEIDTIVYKLHNLDFDSPLQFAKEDPIYIDNTKYKSMHFQPRKGGDCFYNETNCILFKEQDDSRFGGLSDSRIQRGASGSPLVKGNKVYGMLVIGCPLTEQRIKELSDNGDVPKDIGFYNQYIKGSVLNKIFDNLA